MRQASICYKGNKVGFINWTETHFPNNCGCKVISSISHYKNDGSRFTRTEEKIINHLIARDLVKYWGDKTAYVCSFRTDVYNASFITDLKIKSGKSPGKYSKDYEIIFGLLTKKKAEALASRKFLKYWTLEDR